MEEEIGVERQAQQTVPAGESFKSAVQDVITIVEKLAPFCTSINELLKLLEYSLDNDAQARLLMTVVQGRK